MRNKKLKNEKWKIKNIYPVESSYLFHWGKMKPSEITDKKDFTGQEMEN